LAAAEAQVIQAEAQLAALLDDPTSELAAAAAQIAQAQANLDALRKRPNAEDVAVQEAQVEEAAIALDQVQSQGEDALIVAPFGGTILAVNVTEGEWASPGVPAMVLAATKPMILAVNVDEVDVAQLDDGQAAYISFDAIRGEEVAGKVSYIAPSSTNVGGAVAYGVEISFEPGPLPVRLGMTADVDIVVASAEGTVLVPNQAIEADREAGRYYVTVQKPDGTTERREVQIGLRDEENTEVLDGLGEGDPVVLPQVPEQSLRQNPFGPPGGGGRMGGQ
jgi:HlyD family secretion protein